MLYIDLIPRTSHFTNLRSILSTHDWDLLRKNCYKLAKYKCEICGGKGDSHPVECHERWEYNDNKKLQTLTRLEALCPSCHEVTHIGLAEIRNRGDVAINHLMQVNSWTNKEAMDHRRDVFLLWNKRNKIQWKLDISYAKELINTLKGLT